LQHNSQIDLPPHLLNDSTVPWETLSVILGISALAHGAHQTTKLLQRETPKLITEDFWPPNSPDLSPVDCRIWNMIQRSETALINME